MRELIDNLAGPTNEREEWPVTWLKKARRLKRISSRELAELCGMSMNYIQKIEGGDRGMPIETANTIYRALGFTPQEVRFDTSKIIKRVENAKEPEVALAYVLVDDVIYFTDIAEKDDEESFVTTTSNARLLLISQDALLG